MSSFSTDTVDQYVDLIVSNGANDGTGDFRADGLRGIAALDDVAGESTS